MAFGLQIINPSGELVLSDNAYFPCYFGTATFVSTTQPVGVGSFATGSATGGFSTLTFTYAGQIIPVLALPTGRRGSIMSCTQVGSTWTIRVSHTDGTTLTDGALPTVNMYVQTTPTVHVFGFPTSLAETFGGAIWNASGQLRGDFSRRPLLIAQRAVLPAATVSLSGIGALTIPGIAGRATDSDIVGSITGTPDVYRLIYRNSIFSVGGGFLNRHWDKRKQQLEDDIGGSEANARMDSTALWLVECNGL